MKKHTPIILLLLPAIWFLAWRSCSNTHLQLSQSDSPQASQIEELHLDSACTSKSAKPATLQNGIPPASSPWTKGGSERAGRILEQLKELGDSDLPSDVPARGMIPKSKAIEHAGERVDFRNYDRAQAPVVLLIEECFVVRFFNFPNPFRAGENTINTSVVLDAWTGEVLSVRNARGGTKIRIMDRKSQGRTEKEKTANFEKIKAAWLKRSMQIRSGQSSLSGEPKDKMLSVEAIASIARQHAKFRDRNFDPNQKPMVTLVDNIYIVVFWRHPDLIAERGSTYDSRVFIDAYSGRVIGMEITPYLKTNPVADR